MKTDWTDAYDNRKYTPDVDSFLLRWKDSSSVFRAELLAEKRAKLDVAYGPLERNKLDLFLPVGKPLGLIIFVHGGYWHRFDKSLWSQVTECLVGAGWAVAIPSYSLAPEVRISTISKEISAAINRAASLVDGPICLSGHSAGGHLVTRMMCHGSRLKPEVVARLSHVVSISGLHDLRPLMQTEMNRILKLDRHEASSESPALLEPISGVSLTCVVGAIERPEFLRQNDLLTNIWKSFDVPTRSIHVANCHHFSIVDQMLDKSSQLTQAITGDDSWSIWRK